MKPSIYIDPSGVRYNEFPEEPKNCYNTTSCSSACFCNPMASYRAALQVAKDSAVEVSDQEQVQDILIQTGRSLHCGSIHPLPDGYSVEVREFPHLTTSKNLVHRVAILIPTCKACRIEANDEQVKQMPEHTCAKRPKRELPQIKLDRLGNTAEPVLIPTKEEPPLEESQECIFDDMFCKYFDLIYQQKKSTYHACLEIQKQFTITRKP
jgi:hypothetical protein